MAMNTIPTISNGIVDLTILLKGSDVKKKMVNGIRKINTIAISFESRAKK